MGLNRKTIIVVPCFNEAERLRPDAFAAALANDQQLEFIFVNDGSHDATADMLAQLQQRAGVRASVLTLPCNVGKAEAVRQGVLAAFAAHAEYVGYWDADLSTPLASIELLAREIELRNVSLVMGSRVLLMGRNIVRHPMRHYVGRVFATLASVSLGFAVYDTQCGAKLFRACDPLRAAFSRPFDVKWTFDVELLRRLSGLRSAPHRFDVERECVEFPLPEWVGAPGSKLKPSHYPKLLREMLGMTWRGLTQRRRQ